MKNDIEILILLILSFLAILDSSYLLYLHGKSEISEICNLSQTFNCDIVNKGEYSTLDGAIRNITGIPLYFNIPNALLGIVVFSIIGTASMLIYINVLEKPKKTFLLMKSLLLISLVYGSFLIYIQWTLSTWCIFCLMLDAIILSSLIIAFTLKQNQ